MEFFAHSHTEMIGTCMQLSEVVPLWKKQLIESYEGDEELQQLIAESIIDVMGPR